MYIVCVFFHAVKNVIVLFGNGRTSVLKWCNLLMHKMKIVDFTDQNVLVVMKFHAFWSIKFVIFLLCPCDLHHFKTEVLPFPKSIKTFF